MEELLEKAQKLVYEAKLDGKESVVVYTTTNEDYTTTSGGMISWEDLKDDVKGFYRKLMVIYDDKLKTNLKGMGQVEYIIMLES